jgi:hypothetical protein
MAVAVWSSERRRERALSGCNPNQTLARIVFRLNQRSRTTLSN